MMPLLRTTAVLVFLLFQSWAFGEVDQNDDGTSVDVRPKGVPYFGSSVRGLKGPKDKSSKRLKRTTKKKGKSKKNITPATLAPTSTQSPAPGTSGPTLSASTTAFPVPSTAFPTPSTSLPTPFTPMPTSLLLQTFMPTIEASAPTYIISILPTPSPSNSSTGSIRPTNVPTTGSKAPTLRPTGVPPTPTPPTKLPTPPIPPSPPPQSIPTQAPPTTTRPTIPPPTSAPPTQTPPKSKPPTQAPSTKAPQSLGPTPAPSRKTAPNVVNLTPFALNYTLSRPRIPFRTEYIELATVTGTYVTNNFQAYFRNSTSIQLGTVLVIYKTTGNIFFGRPIQVVFDAVASFSASSTKIPSSAQLDSLLNNAFNGRNADVYVSFLQSQLGSGNTFTTTVNVTQSKVPSGLKSLTSNNVDNMSGGGGGSGGGGAGTERAMSTAAISIGAIAAAAFLIAMAVLYQRHRRFDPTTQIDKQPPSYMTVAGGTCETNSLVDSSSLSGRRGYAGNADNSDECDKSVDSSKWSEFANESQRSYRKKTPRQIMTEMDLSSALGEGDSQRSWS